MTFEFPLNVALIPIGIGLAIVILAAVLFRFSNAGGYIVGTIGALFLFVFGPVLFKDKVVVNETGIVQTTGFWFSPTVKGISFEGLESVIITTRFDNQDRANEIWIAVYSSGESREVDPGDLWEMNGQPIREYLIERSINVVRR